MTTQTEALKRIASELRYYNPLADKYKGEFIHKVWAKEIEELLAQQSNEQVEPVAYQDTAKPTELVAAEDFDNIDPQWHWMYQPLYTHPPVPTAQPKPLTHEQIDEIADKFTVHMGEMWEPELCIEFNDSCRSVHSFARAIEAAHGIKE